MKTNPNRKADRVAKKTINQICAEHKKAKQALTNRHRKAMVEERELRSIIDDQYCDLADRLNTQSQEVNRLRELVDKAEHSPDLIQYLIKAWIPDFNKAGIGIVVEGGYVYAIKDSIEVKWAFKHVMKLGLQVLLQMFTPVDVKATKPCENRVNGVLVTFGEAVSSETTTLDG